MANNTVNNDKLLKCATHYAFNIHRKYGVVDRAYTYEDLGMEVWMRLHSKIKYKKGWRSLVYKTTKNCHYTRSKVSRRLDEDKWFHRLHEERPIQEIGSRLPDMLVELIKYYSPHLPAYKMVTIAKLKAEGYTGEEIDLIMRNPKGTSNVIFSKRKELCKLPNTVNYETR